jgi:hydrogenase maturation protease
MPTPPRILVAGIGNIFLGDDAFGSEVARRLLLRHQPANVRIIDFGIRGLDLVYALLDGFDIAILIDAAPRPDQLPGALYLLEPHLDRQGNDSSPPALDAHSMDPVKVLRTALSMGDLPGRVLVVGCQPSHAPQPQDDDESDMSMDMTPPVSAAIDPAMEMVESLIADLASPSPGCSSFLRQVQNEGGGADIPVCLESVSGGIPAPRTDSNEFGPISPKSTTAPLLPYNKLQTPHKRYYHEPDATPPPSFFPPPPFDLR